MLIDQVRKSNVIIAKAVISIFFKKRKYIYRSLVTLFQKEMRINYCCYCCCCKRRHEYEENTMVENNCAVTRKIEVKKLN